MQIAILSIFTIFKDMFKKERVFMRLRKVNSYLQSLGRDGLIPVVTTDHKTQEVLMHGFMNSEALKKTLETGEAHYWSRSRSSIWHKGKTSGYIQKIKEIRIDDDQDISG